MTGVSPTNKQRLLEYIRFCIIFRVERYNNEYWRTAEQHVVKFIRERCSTDIPQVREQCSTDIPQVKEQCSKDIPQVREQCSTDIPQVREHCSTDIPQVR